MYLERILLRFMNFILLVLIILKISNQMIFSNFEFSPKTDDLFV